MNPDSLQSVIDSLQTILSVTSKSIEPYTTLIKSQQQTYNIIVIVLIVLIGANIVIQFVNSKRRLRTEVENVFAEEEDNFKNKINTEIETSFLNFEKQNKISLASIESDVCRAFYSMHIDDNNYDMVFNWGIRTTHKLYEAGDESHSKYFGEKTLEQLKKGIKEWGKDKFIKNYNNTEYSLSDLKSELEKWPKYLLAEKLEIEKILFEDSNNKEEEPSNS